MVTPLSCAWKIIHLDMSQLVENWMQQVTLGCLFGKLRFHPELAVREDESGYRCSIPHSEHIEADAVHAVISHAMQGTTLIEAHSCNIQVTETLDMQEDSKAMSLEDWIVAQSQDPVKREIKYHIREN